MIKMTKHNFSDDQNSKRVRSAVAAGIGIGVPAGYAIHKYGGNLGTYLGDRTNVEHTAKLLVPVQKLGLNLEAPIGSGAHIAYQEFPAVSSTDPVVDIKAPMGIFQHWDNPRMGNIVGNVGNIDSDTLARMRHLAGNALGADLSNARILDIPQQTMIDRANDLVQNPVEFTFNRPRRPSRFVALHTNFAKKTQRWRTWAA